MSLVLGLSSLLGILAAVACVTALAVAAVVRDRKRGTSGTLSNAALEIQSLLEPDKKKTIEMMRARDERKERDEQGED